MKNSFNAAGKRKPGKRRATRPTTRPPNQRRKKRAVKSPDEALLQAIVAENRTAILSALSRDADVNARTKDGVAAIHFAAKTGDAGLLEELLARGAGINLLPLKHEVPVRLGSYTPLVTAIMYHQHAFAAALIAAGADTNLDADAGEAPLHWASWEGDTGTVKTLVEHGAVVDHKHPTTGDTALCMAVSLGHVGVVEYLVEKGADTKIRPDGKTLLMVAAENGYLEIAETLVDHGVPLSARDAQGRDALQIARDAGQDEMADKLLDMISRHNAQKIKTLYMKHHGRGGQTP